MERLSSLTQAAGVAHKSVVCSSFVWGCVLDTMVRPKPIDSTGFQTHNHLPLDNHYTGIATPPSNRSIDQLGGREEMDRIMAVASSASASDSPTSSPWPDAHAAWAQEGGLLAEPWARIVSRHQGAGEALAFLGASG